jgi:excisionase family DNA binding protein
MNQLLLRPAEAAHVLGIGRTKLFELLASGAVESVCIGHSRRIPFDALETYLTKLRAEGSVAS